MREEIKALEKVARLLDPDENIRKEWDTKVLQYANEFINSLEEGKTYTYKDESSHKIYDFNIEEEPQELSSLLEGMKESIDLPGINPASGGHMGYIPGGGLYPSALGDYMAAVSNRYAGVFYAAPGAVRLENMLIQWMCRVMGFPSTAVGNLTSGGSIANLISIVTAREAKVIKARNIEKSVIYLSEQVHHSIQKAIRIAGLGETIIRYVPLDDKLRLSSLELAKCIENDIEKGLNPFLVVASCGTTNTGAIDPFLEIADVQVSSPAEVPITVLIPAFVTSELKTAFQIGFMIFIPFLIIDLVVASILMAMGMMMLSPMIVSLPFKLMLFVLVDGWNLIMGSLANSFGLS